MEGSEGIVSWKTASASRWRSTDDGAVNSKTAGAVKATLNGQNAQWVALLGDYGRRYLRNSMRDDRPVDNVSWMLVSWAPFVQARDLEGKD